MVTKRALRDRLRTIIIPNFAHLLYRQAKFGIIIYERRIGI